MQPFHILKWGKAHSETSHGPARLLPGGRPIPGVLLGLVVIVVWLAVCSPVLCPPAWADHRVAGHLHQWQPACKLGRGLPAAIVRLPGASQGPQQRTCAAHPSLRPLVARAR